MMNLFGEDFERPVEEFSLFAKFHSFLLVMVLNDSRVMCFAEAIILKLDGSKMHAQETPLVKRNPSTCGPRWGFLFDP